MMKKPDTIVAEIHETRCKINERTKDMTTAERTAYFNQRGEAAAKKYGFTIVPSASLRNAHIPDSFAQIPTLRQKNDEDL